MGYYATGSGYIMLDATKKGFQKAANAIGDTWGEIQTETFMVNKSPVLHVDLYPHDDKYYDDEIWEMLQAVAPATIRGSIRYTGEDGILWEFYYDKAAREWKEENAEVYWPSEEDPARRWKDLFATYIANDLESAEPDYVRDVLRDICGMTREEADQLEVSYLFEEEK